MATDSSILTWRIPRTEDPGRLQSMGLQESDKAQQLNLLPTTTFGFPGGSVVKKPSANAGDSRSKVPYMTQEDPPEWEIATHSSILA